MAAPMVDVMEQGTTVVAVAEMIQSSGVMQGLHSVDVGLIIAPVIVELLITQADLAEIEYKVGTEKSDIPDSSMISRAVDNSGEEYFDTGVDPMEEEIMEEAPQVQPEGIMSRREV